MATIVGHTPLVDASGLSPNPRVRIVVKLEGQNPWGSLKDRAARRITASSNAALLDQYRSESNPAAHRDTTAREILLAVPDVTHFVGVFGTGGCLLGVGQRFLMEAPRIRTLAVDPPKGAQVEGVRRRRDVEAMPLFHRWRGSKVIHGRHTSSAGGGRRAPPWHQLAGDRPFICDTAKAQAWSCNAAFATLGSFTDAPRRTLVLGARSRTTRVTPGGATARPCGPRSIESIA